MTLSAEISRLARAPGSVVGRVFVDHDGLIGEAFARVRAWRRALVMAAALIAVAPAGFAQSVSVSCERLDRPARDELRARMRLAVRSADGGSPFVVRLECSEREATLVWVAAFEERIPVDESSGLVEGTLDAIEQRLSARDPPRRRRPPPPAPAPEPPPAPPPPPRRGGVGLGLALELSPATAGPRFDFGIPIGPLNVVAMQSLRAAPADSWLVGAEGGLGWGAPYDSELPLGVALAIGMEALSVSSARGGPSAAAWSYTTYASVGVRGALPWDRASVFMAVDLRRRFGSLMTEEPQVKLADTAVLLSLGTVLGLELGERRRRRVVNPP